MRDKDIKILWGRSGNRCAICKLELTPDGIRETLGEMAHIIARSTDGPRGGVATSAGDLDAYENLVLLCPTHHTEIDKDPYAWPITRLRAAKAVKSTSVGIGILGAVNDPPVSANGNTPKTGCFLTPPELFSLRTGLACDVS